MSTAEGAGADESAELIERGDLTVPFVRPFSKGRRNLVC